ncbi:MAG TPA: aldo/keto reductase [Candidatus Blautia pullistercoris]|uniref:Aldo/keto reductase n=1 Tax=Candidatus Blautia pullistercoris TaxID=2838499 RepID=A0A9D1VLP1_9FIRM|nr:aldo/keto reductase [Clostridiales bacterium]HIX37529.1 aldo/keto reductase [Candidatus Blautia pullistercoris]
MSFGEHVIHLNDGREMPLLGLGVYKATDNDELKQAISSAVSWGYHLIDTASFYKNEEGVGKGIQALNLPREDLFVTTKIWNTAQRIGDIEDSFNRSLERLALDYVDLYLIHWPVPGCFGNTWKAMEKLQEQGKVRSIGVSNFGIQDLELLKTVSDVIPAVNQVEFHPLFNHPELKAYCEENGIALQAYAPLARGAYLKSPLMIEIGKSHQKSPAQVGLRWLVQQGIAVIPKSIHEERLAENSQIFDFVLSDEEMAAITAMDVQQRVAGVPEDMVPYIV